MIGTAFTDLWYGFGVALEPHNIIWCFVGVLVGNMVGVLPGMGPLATISILLPLTYGINPVGAILMLAGVMYGAQYGGAICSILLNLPCHPPHAVTCLDGFPMTTVNARYANVTLKDMRPSREEMRRAIAPMFRGTLIGSLCSLIPGTGPTIASFVAYATEKRISKTPEKFGTGMIEGVVCPEASTHSSVQGDFIPTMSLGIPGDAVMALLLGALMIQGIVPGPQLIKEHPDIFWGLIASFWIGNIMLVVLNVPLIGVWVKLLTIPYRYLYPSAMFFVCIGVYAANNDVFQVGETAVIGFFGYLLLRLGFHPAPILLGFVLGPRFEDNFRRAMMISRGHLGVFVERPISAVFVTLCVLLIALQIYVRLRPKNSKTMTAALEGSGAIASSQSRSA